MELKSVSSSSFQGGSGGGTFYQGRQEPPKDKDEDDENSPDQEADRFKRGHRVPLGRDGSYVAGGGQRSNLSLLPSLQRSAPRDVLEGLDHELQGKVRLLTLSIVRLERDFERRMRAEVGDVVIGA